MYKAQCWLVIFAIISTLQVSAEWHTLDNSAPVGEKIKVQLLSATATELLVEITVPGYDLQEVIADQTLCQTMDIPGSSVLMKRGYPSIPKLGKLLCIPDNCDVSLQVLSKIEIERDFQLPIVPSKGHFTRDIHPKDVEFTFAPIYQQDRYWPTEQFTLGECFTFRDVRGVRMRVLPVSCNHVQKKVKILRKAIVAIRCKPKNDVAIRRSLIPGKTYGKIYDDMFLGYQNPTIQLAPESRKLVVIVPTQYQDTIQAWVEWKQKAGYQVTIHTIPHHTRSYEIKDYLQDLYDHPATRFGYVVLIGDANYSAYYEDAQPMPTFEGTKEGAAADRIYVRLDGDDNYPDACISRISGDTEDEIKNQLDKIMQYEQNRLTGGDWLQKGICVASDEGHFKDWQRAEWLQNGGSKSQNVPIQNGGLLANGFTSFADVYDPGATAVKVMQAVNGGSSIICYIGHGTPTSWVTSSFHNDDVRNLSNNGSYPVIWSVACVNGKFVERKECFAEAWLRKNAGGAVAMEAASTNESWVPPCDKQAATINSIIAKSASTFGTQELVGCLRAMEIWGDEDDSEGNKLAEQCNLFGDCTMMTKYGKQTLLEVLLSYKAGNAVFQITSQGQVVADAVVTVYSENFAYKISQDTDSAGKTTVALATRSKGQLLYTVVAPNCIPVIDQPLD